MIACVCWRDAAIPWAPVQPGFLTMAVTTTAAAVVLMLNLILVVANCGRSPPRP
jgi:hypothetical protein